MSEDIVVETEDKPKKKSSKTKKKVKAAAKTKGKKSKSKKKSSAVSRKKYDLSGPRKTIKVAGKLVDMLEIIAKKGGFESMDEAVDKVMVHGISRHWALIKYEESKN